MVRTTALPRPSLLMIRLGTVAVATSLTVGALAACGSSEGESSAVEIIPVTEYVASAVVHEPVPEPVGFVVPEGVTYTQAESAYFEKRYSDATAMFTAIVERKPENAWNHFMLGLSAWKAGDHQLAESAFTAALERDPKHLKSELNLTRVLLETGRPEKALVRVQNALTIDSTSAETWRLLGRVQGELRQVEPAMEAYRKAITLDEQDVWSMNNLGLVLIKAGRFQEAVGPLARATQIDSSVAAFQNNLGMALERTGYFTAARTAYQAAVASDSTYGRAVANLARIAEIEDSPLLVALDLEALATTFVAEIRSAAQGTVVMVPPPAGDGR